MKTYLIQDPAYARSPVVAVNPDDTCYVAWISWISPEAECVRYCFKQAGEEDWSQPQTLGHPAPCITSLAMCAYNDGAMVSSITTGSTGTDGVKVGLVTHAHAGEEVVVASNEHQPAHLSLASHGRSFALAYTLARPDGRSVSLRLGESPEALHPAMTIDAGRGMCLRPNVAFNGQEWVAVWECQDKDAFEIHHRTIGTDLSLGDIRCLFSDPASIPAFPVLGHAPDGRTWIAWHTDHGAGEGGLSRWITLIGVDKDGQLSEPIFSMTDVGRDGRGEDQGFEMPSLVVTPDGHVALFGRGSHSLRRQDLGAQGWCDRNQLDEPGWKCRGVRVHASLATDRIYLVGRENKGIVVRELEMTLTGTEGRPGLQPTGTISSLIHAAERTTTGFGETAHPRHEIAGKRILFGDLHQHTALSDGTGSAEESYARASKRYQDDFVAISDHEAFLGKRTTPGEWREIRRIANEYNRAGELAVLPAYEWTGKMHPGPGHKVVYSDNDHFLSRDNEETMTSVGLMAAAKRTGAIVIPHHVGWTGADMAAHDPDVQPCFEIVSCHGAYEAMGMTPIGTRGDDKPGQFIRDALDAGLRFGLVGGSDGHGLDWHHGVCRCRDSHRTGLTAIFAPSPTRDAVLTALRNRRCYATSGAKIGLWFDVNGAPMGAEIPSTPDLCAHVIINCTAPIHTLHLVTNHGEEIPVDFQDSRSDTTLTIQPPNPGAWCYYFVRVIQTDGEIAWSSPIWIDSAP